MRKHIKTMVQGERRKVHRSDLPSMRRMCDRKTRYPTAEHAAVAASKALRRRPGALRYYECPWCGGWHLTSKVEVKP